MKEKKDRVEDALHATKAALEEGILPGGGIALLNAANELSFVETETPELNIGYDIIINACERPFFKILENSGLDQDTIFSIEEDIKENGVSLGELQSKLLRKIEELTLYVIEQDKKYETQNIRLKKIQKENADLRRQNTEVRNQNKAILKMLEIK